MPIVFDPVMVATSGAALADDATIAAFGRLMDVATIATPNLPELRRLTGEEDPVAAALQLVLGKHRCAVLIKGGHEEGDALADALIEDDNMTSWQGQRIDTTSTHGTGCTLASAIALFLARGPAPAARGRPARASSSASRCTRRRGSGRATGRSARPTCGSTSARADAAAQPGHGDRQRLCQVGRLLPRARPASRSSTVPTMAMPGSKPAAARPCRSRPTPRRRSRRPPRSISNATTSTREVERLARLGIPFEHGPRNQPWMWREARLRDPVGQYHLPLQGRRSAPLPAVADGRIIHRNFRTLAATASRH